VTDSPEATPRLQPVRRTVFSCTGLALFGLAIGLLASYAVVLLPFEQIVASQDDTAFACVGSGFDALDTCITDEPGVIASIQSSDVVVAANGTLTQLTMAYPANLAQLLSAGQPVHVEILHPSGRVISLTSGDVVFPTVDNPDVMRDRTLIVALGCALLALTLVFTARGTARRFGRWRDASATTMPSHLAIAALTSLSAAAGITVAAIGIAGYEPGAALVAGATALVAAFAIHLLDTPVRRQVSSFRLATSGVTWAV
jgi:hypothetical protein